jgi:hypothetical protein
MSEPNELFSDTEPSGFLDADADAAVPATPAAPAAAPPARPWWHWLIEGARTALFMRPRTLGLQAGPITVAVLLVVVALAKIGLQRLAVDGPVAFNARAIASGWFVTLLLLGAAWVVVRARAAKSGDSDSGAREPCTATFFALLLAQGLVMDGVLSTASMAAAHWLPLLIPARGDELIWWGWIAVLVWFAIATGWLLWRMAPKQFAPRAVAAMAVAAAIASTVWAPSAWYWYPDRSAAPESAEDATPTLHLTQDLIESQITVLTEALNRVQAGRPGIVDLYAITFAPYADEDVFSREAGMVSELMRTRFDAPQRTVQLQNHLRTAADLPWATPLNLQRTIQRMAEVMNRDEDVLFIHLTSHGARNGHLATSFWPLEIDDVTPQQLKTWLDEAGVRYRVISISACFSGSWIAPLADPGTLVMTAADADHTSYGCGRKSDLTFFGRAMYDEQLRHGHSFEAAHAAVRPVIEQREKEAGKTDGYSNPQISVGAAVRRPLAELQQRLDALPPPPAAQMP